MVLCAHVDYSHMVCVSSLFITFFFKASALSAVLLFFFLLLPLAWTVKNPWKKKTISRPLMVKELLDKGPPPVVKGGKQFLTSCLRETRVSSCFCFCVNDSLDIDKRAITYNGPRLEKIYIYRKNIEKFPKTRFSARPSPAFPSSFCAVSAHLNLSGVNESLTCFSAATLLFLSDSLFIYVWYFIAVVSGRDIAKPLDQ